MSPHPEIFTFVTLGLLFVVGVSGMIAAVMPWWTTGLAGKILGQDDATDASIGLWEFSVTVPVQGEMGMTPTEFTMTWEDYCTALGQIGNGPAELDEPAACSTIQAARAMTILTILLAAFSGLFVLASHFTTPLLLIGAAFGSILTTTMGVVGAGMAVLVGTSGIGGIGAMSMGVAVVMSAGSVGASFFTASQAMRPEDHEAANRAPREVRAAQARAKAAAESAELEEHMAASNHSGSRKSGSGRDKEPKQRPMPHLKKVIFWNKDKALHDENEEIPTSLLEKAFREIDKDNGGNIDSKELVDALKGCGLNASEAATDTILKEIDKNASGDVDIHEFVEFFRHIEEMSNFQKKNQRRAQFLTIICNGCFICHVILVCTLLMLVVRMDEESDPDNYSLMRTLLMVGCVFLAMLFSVVIAIPALRITIGPHWAVWEAHYQMEAANRGKKKLPTQQGLDEDTLRSAAWAANRPMPGPVAGLPGPVAVNTAMYGASWRRPKALPGVEDTGEYGGTIGLGGTLGTRGSHDSSESTGIILDADGGFERYDPASYWQAQRMSMEKDPPRSFNPMQVHSISRPEEDIRQDAIENQMIALPGAATGNTQMSYYT